MGTVTMLVIITIAIALIFDVINGFHDAANSIATVVSTRVLTPRAAVLWAAAFNFAAMFVFAPKVAKTISEVVKIMPNDHSFVVVVLAALLGAILWDVLTWLWGLPTSSSHALIGGLMGAGLAHGGASSIQWGKIGKTVLFIPLAPLIGYVIGSLVMLAVFWMFRRRPPLQVDRFFRHAQLASAGLYSLGHGANDAQKTMGVIVAVLLAAGVFEPGVELSLASRQTMWIVLSCNVAMAFGTAIGGWRIVKTMGMKMTKLKPVGGFCAETSGAITLFAATALGAPVSTTHTISGAIIGVGSLSNSSGVKWGVARNIVWAWILTIPFSALTSALCFYALDALHVHG